MIQTRVDSVRGCGWRQPGGLYLVSDDLAGSCGRLPFPLVVCPCCGEGISFSRAWSWVDVAKLAKAIVCDWPPKYCDECLMRNPPERAGLIWIGREFYSPQAFTFEAAGQGVSRRIKSVPRGFVVGETWVALAHVDAIATKHIPGTTGRRKGTPGIFHLFKPQAIEYVVTGDETQKELEALIVRGITPVRIEKLETREMDLGDTTEGNHV